MPKAAYVRDNFHLDDLLEIVFPEKKKIFSQVEYKDPRVKLGYWYENAYKHPILEGKHIVNTIYRKNYCIQDLRPIKKRLETWTVEPHEQFNYSKEAYSHYIVRNGNDAKYALTRYDAHEFQNNYATTYSLYHKNAITHEFQHLLDQPNTDKLIINYGRPAEYGLREYMIQKWKEQNSREELYPKIDTQYNHDYQAQKDPQYLPRKAIKKEMSMSFFKVYLQNRLNPTRGIPMRILPDHPDHLKNVDPNRLIQNIIPFTGNAI